MEDEDGDGSEECRTTVLCACRRQLLIKSCRNDGMRKVTGRPASGARLAGLII